MFHCHVWLPEGKRNLKIWMNMWCDRHHVKRVIMKPEKAMMTKTTKHPLILDELWSFTALKHGYSRDSYLNSHGSRDVAIGLIAPLELRGSPVVCKASPENRLGSWNEDRALDTLVHHNVPQKEQPGSGIQAVNRILLLRNCEFSFKKWEPKPQKRRTHKDHGGW
jgi:hypothetical protein